ncbi:hypothetical protein J1605_007409 [Eschrichtius robustus]|uniref:Uncharacterized protein n=1 Tax=Eschrichtius robustus TaxID=9764 RepID=A0AB34H3L1_ESCRO|nr:hypothetical protein J1605_007409 [Eschrichtius robustus]
MEERDIKRRLPAGVPSQHQGTQLLGRRRNSEPEPHAPGGGGRQRALPHTLRPLWPSLSQWPRKVTWTRKWSSSRLHRWERGTGLRGRPAGGRTAAVSHLRRPGTQAL